jgi:NTE family protein
MRCFKTLIPALVFMAVSFAAEPARPRIGVVLSGGSALGLSHIGVLQWLEEHHIPIDFIGGTSMGALVGGLYATGHNSTETKEFVKNIDWTAIFNSSAPFEALQFRRKEDRREFPNRLEFGLRHGIRLPTGLSAGHEVGLAISHFAAPYEQVQSFDDLPTPFRCVATDLIEGKEFVFLGGNLPTALRATMSLPALFSPLAYDGKMLVDGAVLDNLPVTVVKEMGADIIIAVALVDPPATPGNLESLLGVAGRALTVMVDDNERRHMALADMLIAPDLKGLTSSDYANYVELSARGYQAAEKKKRFLETLSVSQVEWDLYIAERQKKRRPESITGQFVQVTGIKGSEAKTFEHDLDKALSGKPLDTRELDKQLTLITGYGPYRNASYGFIQKNGADGLLVNVREKPYGPPFLNTAVNIEGSDTANVRFGLSGRLTFMDFGCPGCEWRSDLTVGYTNLIGSEYYWRLRGSRWFLAPRASVSRSLQDYYSGNNRVAQFSIGQAIAGGDIGYSANRSTEFRFGYQYDHQRVSVSTGVPLLDFRHGLQTVHARVAYDGQDSAAIPLHGLHSTTDVRWNFGTVAGTSDFATFEQTLTAARSFGDRYVMIGALDGGSVIGPQFPLPQFTLGGPFAMSALGTWQQRGDQYYYAGVQGLRAFSNVRGGFFNRTYADLGFEMGRAFAKNGNGLPYYDGLIGVVSETPIGVIVFGYSLGSSGNHRFFFRLGRLF